MATAADADLLDADEQREDVACNASPTMSVGSGQYYNYCVPCCVQTAVLVLSCCTALRGVHRA